MKTQVQNAQKISSKHAQEEWGAEVKESHTTNPMWPCCSLSSESEYNSVSTTALLLPIQCYHMATAPSLANLRPRLQASFSFLPGEKNHNVNVHAHCTCIYIECFKRMLFLYPSATLLPCYIRTIPWNVLNVLFTSTYVHVYTCRLERHVLRSGL